MGYQLRKIRERAIANGYFADPKKKKAKPAKPQAPGKHARTYEEVKAAAARQREERREQAAVQREATRVEQPGRWARIRGTIGGLFRRKA